MNGREIIKDIMNKEGKKNAEVAYSLGISQAALWDRLNNKKVKDIPLSLLVSMLRVLNYKVVIVPRNAKVPQDSYVVEQRAEGE